MACNCSNKAQGPAAESYVVRLNNGRTEEVDSKVAADILVTKHGGSYTVKKK